MKAVHEILQFWFVETGPKAVEAGSGVRRADPPPVRELHARAAHGELYGWRTTAGGRLAEVIVLDQFSRNLFRDSARAYAQDLAALALAQEAV